MGIADTFRSQSVSSVSFSNFAKILDGNYDNEKGKAHLPRGDDKFSAIRQWAESKGVKMD